MRPLIFADAVIGWLPSVFTYNGNRFASIIALVIKKLDLPAEQAFIVRSLAGHIVAGVSDEEEERAFREFCESLD